MSCLDLNYNSFAFTKVGNEIIFKSIFFKLSCNLFDHKIFDARMSIPEFKKQEMTSCVVQTMGTSIWLNEVLIIIGQPVC
jgi:hypothetical protein